MGEGLEKKVRNALIVGGIILGSLITGVKVWDYYRMLATYEDMEDVRGKEDARKEAREYIQKNKPLPSRILCYSELKASKNYLKNSSEETSKF